MREKTEEELSESPARLTPLDLTLDEIPLGGGSSFHPSQQPIINPGYISDHPGSPEWQTIDFDDPPFFQPCYGQRRNTQDFSIHELPSIQSLSSPLPEEDKDITPHVVVKQPRRAATTESVPEGRPWTYGLFECTGDRTICLKGTFCSPCLACQVSRDLEESAWVPCCVPYWQLVLRTKLRAHQDIAGSVLIDCCEVTWCSPCVLCQMAREIDHCQAEGMM